MSKITLEPNSSGDGTFSIVSPDSNINRTLTLGDESGTIRTIEGIESRQNDFAQMPLVAGSPIVESDSNNDGEWTRWADGTQIIRTQVIHDFNDSIAQTYPYPKSFDSRAYPAVAQNIFDSSAADRLAQQVTFVISNNSTSFRLNTQENNRTLSNSTVYVQAVGTWS